MIHTSVIIPERDAADAVEAQLPELCRTLDQLGEAYEIVVVDDCSRTTETRKFKSLLTQYDCLRVVQLDSPLGVSAALSAGLTCARGRVIVAIEAGNRFPSKQIKQLLNGLTRADIVFGRRRLTAWERTWHRITRIPRWLLLGLDSHDPDSLFWAAHSEALAGIQLPRGMHRYLATFVAMRGYRVGEVYVESRKRRKPVSEAWPNPGDLLCAWWLKRRWRESSATQLLADEALKPNLSIAQVNPSEPGVSHGYVQASEKKSA